MNKVENGFVIQMKVNGKWEFFGTRFYIEKKWAIEDVKGYSGNEFRVVPVKRTTEIRNESTS